MLRKLNKCSHSDSLLIFFLLPRTGLLIAFLVVSGSVKAMEDHSLFAEYKPTNKVKCKEVQCVYFIIARNTDGVDFCFTSNISAVLV